MPRKEENLTPEEAQAEISIWLGDAKQNIKNAVADFLLQWQPWPCFALGVEVMDKGQLRDLIGVRSSDEYGDPWPKVERSLLDAGFAWHTLGGSRVMFLKERNDAPTPGWDDGEEVES